MHNKSTSLSLVRQPAAPLTAGLSQLQRRILAIALRNQEQHGGKLQFMTADGLQEIYGFIPRNPSRHRFPCTQQFRIEDIGRQRYASAKVAVHKAVRRLEARGLVAPMVNIVGRFAGVNLTEEGKTAAEQLTANLVVNLPPSKPLGEMANLGQISDTSKPLDTAEARP
jgi:hypothetical protein